MRSGLITAGAALGLLAACAAILLSPGAIRAPTVKPVGEMARGGSDGTGQNQPDSGSRVVKSSVAQNARQGQSESTETTSPIPERIDARDPLSKIGQALPPRPKPPGEWKGTTLFNPVATAAGLIEAKGYRLAIAGVKAVQADETCSYEGRDWPCGLRARAAFRAWLRARAVTCVVPPDPEREIIVAECSVGKQDIGGWLVANGWARADGDTYASLNDEASTGAKGIFGRPGPTEAPTSSIITSTLPSPSSQGVILAPNAAAQEDVFPPAPPAPSGSIITLPAAPLPPAQ